MFGAAVEGLVLGRKDLHNLGEKQHIYIWVFPKIGVPQNGWFIMENPIKIQHLGVTLFLETPIHLRWDAYLEDHPRTIQGLDTW